MFSYYVLAEIREHVKLEFRCGKVKEYLPHNGLTIFNIHIQTMYNTKEDKHVIDIFNESNKEHISLGYGEASSERVVEEIYKLLTKRYDQVSYETYEIMVSNFLYDNTRDLSIIPSILGEAEDKGYILRPHLFGIHHYRIISPNGNPWCIFSDGRDVNIIKEGGSSSNMGTFKLKELTFDVLDRAISLCDS